MWWPGLREPARPRGEPCVRVPGGAAFSQLGAGARPRSLGRGSCTGGALEGRWGSRLVSVVVGQLDPVFRTLPVEVGCCWWRLLLCPWGGLAEEQAQAWLQAFRVQTCRGPFSPFLGEASLPLPVPKLKVWFRFTLKSFRF